jgi:hypothetical protein
MPLPGSDAFYGRFCIILGAQTAFSPAQHFPKTGLVDMSRHICLVENSNVGNPGVD